MKDLIARINWVDYLIFVGIIRGLYVGYRDGYFAEILRITSYVISILIAVKFYPALSAQVTLNSFLNAAASSVIAFGMLLIGGFIGTKLLRSLILKLLKVGEGGVPGKVIGLLIGGCRWLILLSLILLLIDRLPVSQLNKDIHERSLTGHKVAAAGPVIFDYLASLSPQLELSKKS